MIPCVWYVSGAVQPWERAVIGSMASGLRARGVSLSLYVDGGTLGVDAQSWRSLTGLERIGHVLFSGRRTLWHLWGPPPSWWGLVRLRSRTIHTSFEAKTVWKGYPSRLFPAQAPEGEAILIPTFDFRVSRLDLGPSEPAIYAGSPSQALWDALSSSEGKGLPGIVDLRALRPSSALNGVLVAGPSPSDALCAASLTMRGLAVAALRSPFLDALVGSEGYLVCPADTPKDWRRTLEAALSNEGRQRAVPARHLLKLHCSADRSADSLVAAYREVMGGEPLS